MRALSINPYKATVTETNIPPGLAGLQAAVRGPIEFLHKFDNGDILRLADHKELFFETNFHIGLEEEGTRFLPYRKGQDPRTVILVLQDENTICRAVRTTVMPPDVCDAIETTVEDQVTESATEAAFEEKFNASMQRYYARMPTPKVGFFRARIKG